VYKHPLGRHLKFCRRNSYFIPNTLLAAHHLSNMVYTCWNTAKLLQLKDFQYGGYDLELWLRPLECQQWHWSQILDIGVLSIRRIPSRLGLGVRFRRFEIRRNELDLDNNIICAKFHENRTCLRSRRQGGCVYVLPMFFGFFRRPPQNMRQPFSGTAERIFMKLLPNDSGENWVLNVVPKWGLGPK